MEKKCDECGKPFDVDDTKRNWQSVLLCSDECRRTRAAKARREKYTKQKWPQERKCEWCGVTFLIGGPGGKPRKYCSRDCYLAKKSDESAKKWEKNRRVKYCLSCEKPFFPEKHASNWQKYCSPTCFQRAMRETHGYHKSSTSEFNRIRKEVLKEYGRICQLCGATKKPHVHHWDNSRDGVFMNNSFENLTVLCRNCHAAFHHVSVIKAGDTWKVSGKIFEKLGLSESIEII